MIDKIIDAIINQKGTSQPEESRSDEMYTLHKVAKLGQVAIDLESSEAYQLFILPYIESTVKGCIETIIIDGVNQSNEWKNNILMDMRSALNILALIKQAKTDATRANKVLNEQSGLEDKAKKRKQDHEKVVRGRQVAINRKVGADKRKKK